MSFIEPVDTLNHNELSDKFAYYCSNYPNDAENLEYCGQIIMRIAHKFVLHKYKIFNSDVEREDFESIVIDKLWELVRTQYKITVCWNLLTFMTPELLQKWLRESKPKLIDNIDNYRVTHVDIPSFEHVDSRIMKECLCDSVKILFKELNKIPIHNSHISSKVARTNVHISLVLSVKYDRFINFRLSGRDLVICRYAYNRFKLLLDQLLSQIEIDKIPQKRIRDSLISELRGDDNEEN